MKIDQDNLADAKNNCFFYLRIARTVLGCAIVCFIMGGGIFALPEPGNHETPRIPPEQLLWVLLCAFFLSCGVIATCFDSFDWVKRFLSMGLWDAFPSSENDKEVALMQYFPQMSTIRSLGIIVGNLTLLLLTLGADICLWSNYITLERWCWVTFIMALCWSLVMLILVAGYRLFLYVTDFRESAQPILPQ